MMHNGKSNVKDRKQDRGLIIYSHIAKQNHATQIMPVVESTAIIKQPRAPYDLTGPEAA